MIDWTVVISVCVAMALCAAVKLVFAVVVATVGAIIKCCIKDD